MKRLISIDVIKTLAVFFMVQQHFLYYLSPWDRLGYLFDHSWLQRWVDLDVYSAPIFVFMAGYSVWFWLQKQKQNNHINCSLDMIIRGGVIFLFGCFVSFVVRDVFSNNILSVIGLAIIILPLLWGSFKLVLCSVLFIFGIASFLQAYFEVAFGEWSWIASFEDWPSVVFWKEVLVDYLLRGDQGFIPWMGYLWLGYLTAQWLFSKAVKNGFYTVICVGLLLVLCGLIVEEFKWGNPWVYKYEYYPATSVFLLHTVGVIFVLIGLFRWFDVSKREWFFGKVCQLIGRYILSTYLIHVSFISLIEDYFGYLRYDYSRHDSPEIAVLVIMLFSWLYLVLWYFVMKWWHEKFQGKYSFEWFVRKISQRFSVV